MADPRTTSDPDDVERWADERDAVPVREGDRLRLVRESDVTTGHERLDWETFHREVNEAGHVVTYYGETDDREPFEVGDRGSAADAGDAGDDGDDGDARVLPEKSDEGKPVVYHSGNQIGEVVDVNDGVAFVDPHPNLAEKVMARLGVDEDEEYYRLHEDRIDRITDDEVVVSTGEFAGGLDEDADR